MEDSPASNSTDNYAATQYDPSPGHERMWTSRQVEKLVDLYAEQPALYDTTLSLYRDREARGLALQKIAGTLNCSVDDVTKKIHTLRTQYLKYRVDGKDNSASHKRSWVLSILSFLEPFVKSRKGNPDETQDMSSVSNGYDPASTRPRNNRSQPPVNPHYSLPTDNNEQQQQSDNNTDEDNATEDNGSMDNTPPEPDVKWTTKRSTVKRRGRPPAQDGSKRVRFDPVVGYIRAMMEACERIASSTSREMTDEGNSNSDVLFGRYIASELRNCTSEQAKAVAKVKISQALLELQLHH